MRHDAARSPAPLHIVGAGPGDRGLLAPLALEAIARSRAVFGYVRYIGLLPEEATAGKRIEASGMTRERERCEAALAAALGGEESALVSSGDPGVYAMAGLVFELMDRRGLTVRDVPVTVTPGIPALCAAAALLGAPLMHDFAAVSLSDLLTPWELIEKRLFHALAGDFILALYNPRSQGRRDHLARALKLAAAARPPETPLGHVRNAFRQEQGVHLSVLRRFNPGDADMLSIIILGNSTTRILRAPGADPLDWRGGARMYTPRGYMEKYGTEHRKTFSPGLSFPP
jgi:precorrin-3B C17-methyltransferase/cobalt-precorrin 5A hydrolase/precorrin-3B C17-methyltransferase